MVEIYRHPDGMGAIMFEAATGRLFTLNDAECLSAYAVIGPIGLRVLACRLLAAADELEAQP